MTMEPSGCFGTRYVRVCWYQCSVAASDVEIRSITRPHRPHLNSKPWVFESISSQINSAFMRKERGVTWYSSAFWQSCGRVEIVFIVCIPLFNVKVAHHSQTGQQQADCQTYQYLYDSVVKKMRVESEKNKITASTARMIITLLFSGYQFASIGKVVHLTERLMRPFWIGN